MGQPRGRLRAGQCLCGRKVSPRRVSTSSLRSTGSEPLQARWVLADSLGTSDGSGPWVTSCSLPATSHPTHVPAHPLRWVAMANLWAAPGSSQDEQHCP